ncbi:MAG: hypothetical protein AB7E09_07920 [Candidatus Izemoplasmatales bacterium]
MSKDEYQFRDLQRPPDEYQTYQELLIRNDDVNINAKSSSNQKDKKGIFKNFTHFMKSAFVIVVAAPVIVLAAESSGSSIDLEIYDLGYHHLTLLVRYDGLASVKVSGYDYESIYEIIPYEDHYQEEFPEYESEYYLPEYYIEFFGLMDDYWYKLEVFDEEGYKIYEDSIHTLTLVNVEDMPPPELSYFSYYSDLVNQSLYLYVSFNDPNYFLYDFQYHIIIDDQIYYIEALSNSKYGGSIDMTKFGEVFYFQIKISAKSRHPLNEGELIVINDVYYE